MVDLGTFGNKDAHIYLAKYLNKPENEQYIAQVGKIVNTFNSYINDLKETKHKCHYLSMLLHETLSKIENLKFPNEIERNLLWIIKTRYKNETKGKNPIDWWHTKRKTFNDLD